VINWRSYALIAYPRSQSLYFGPPLRKLLHNAFWNEHTIPVPPIRHVVKLALFYPLIDSLIRHPQLVCYLGNCPEAIIWIPDVSFHVLLLSVIETVYIINRYLSILN
jgi:hypothetical protein